MPLRRMSLTRLTLLSATYHWRTNLAVCLGVAAAVAVLGGALLVGDSVRGSLRDLAVSRLGRTGDVVSSTGYFREALASELGRSFSDTAPLIATRGAVTHEASGSRASSVLVYGVDERFWRFHGLEAQDGVFASPGLAAELHASDGDVLLVRLQKPSEIPLESLFAQKEDLARTVRLTLTGVLPAESLGEFSLQPQQAEVRAMFLPLRRLQRDLATPGRINTVLLPETTGTMVAERALRQAVSLEDIGVRVRLSDDGSTVMLESSSGIINPPLEQSARSAGEALGLRTFPVFTYLANTIRVAGREVPYSLVAGLDLGALPQTAGSSTQPRLDRRPSIGQEEAIVINTWLARELSASVGDRLELDYYLWDAASGLTTSTAAFVVTAVVPMAGLAADRHLAPEYPGITGAESLADWDPPFPLDLRRIRRQDEEYWDKFRATPKAFIRYERARDLWATRYGRVTGLRFLPAPGQNVRQRADALQARLRESVVPASQGLALTPVRRVALEASTGATNFGEYFTYFSFFIVVSAVMLAMLFFRLGVEQRLRQIGILRASGYTTAHIRRMLLTEAVVLALAGSVIGAIGAILYAHLIVHGLKTWWVGAVGTTLLRVHVSPGSLLLGAFGGTLAALVCVVWSLRAVARRSPRALLDAYSLEQPAGFDPHRARRAARLAGLMAVIGFVLLALGFVSPRSQAGAFFGAGAALLVSILSFLASWLRARDRRAISGRGAWAVSRLGFRGAAFRPGRTVLSAALVASAAFIIVSVDAFRRDGGAMTDDPKSGTGGFVLLAESAVPIVHNPNEESGRDALLLHGPELSRTRFARFRLRPGEDASCLNLYRPGNPTIIAPERTFVESGRFSFSASLAETEGERANPWLLLQRTFEDGTVPAIADATSLQYVLHATLGDTMSVDVGRERPLVLRFVGALRDSVLQGQLIIGEDQFLRLFPGHDGFRFFLIDSPDVTTTSQASSLAAIVERELEPFGLDAVSTTERLEAFHRVENTYLSTFQALGGLGLLLGTMGLATVMFRNVLERRRELALLRAVGYNARHVTIMILAEAMFLLTAGVLAGAGCALIAIAPAWLDRGSAPGLGLALLLGGVLIGGLLSAVAATRAALSGDLLHALRAE